MKARPKITRIDGEPKEMMPGKRGWRLPLVGPEDGARNVDVHINILKADSGPGPTHYHAESENIYIVIEGTVEVIIEGKKYLASAGDVAFIPPGLHHSAATAGDKPARIIEIYAPPISTPSGRDFHIVSGGYEE